MGLHPALPEICVVSFLPVSEGGRWTSVSPEWLGWKDNCETLWAQSTQALLCLAMACELRHEPKLLDSPLCFTFRKFPTSWEIYLAEPQPKIKQDYYPSDLEKISV